MALPPPVLAQGLRGALQRGPAGVPGLAGQRVRAPLDRSHVAIPPAYPPVPRGFLRLPDTRSAPVTAARPLVPARPERVTVDGILPRPVDAPPPARPAWQASRLEPVVGIDERGRIGSILEYTPPQLAR
jgi:hypothetical protein